MQKQFDIIVLSKEELQPQIEDRALGWFTAENFSDVVHDLDAEWTILAKPSVRITRPFLNAVADACVDFPYADAFAPRILNADSHEVLSSGFLIDLKKGMEEEFRTNENAEIRPIASLSPECGIYSTRLLQALHGFDPDIFTDMRFLDLGLRALHLGANLFATPRIHVETITKQMADPIKDADCVKELGCVFYKNLDIIRYFQFAFHHPTAFNALFKNRKELNAKSLQVTELSKFTEETFHKVST